jgi:hypothetical protein
MDLEKIINLFTAKGAKNAKVFIQFNIFAFFASFAV